MKIIYLKLVVYGYMIFGVWPYWNNKILQKIHAYFFIVYQGLSVVSICGGYVHCENSISCYFETTAYFLVHFIGFYCTLTFYIKFDSARDCLVRLHRFIETFGYNNYVRNGERQGIRFTLICYVYALFGTMLYNFASLIMYEDCLESVEISAAPCGMPVSESIPLDIDKNPQYGIVFALLYFGGNLAIYSIVLALLFAFLLLLHVKEQIEYLKYNLRLLNKNPNKEQIYLLLKDYVIHHIRITMYFKDVQATFNEIILLTFASMSLSLSIYAFECIYFFLNGSYVWLLKSFMLLSGYTFIFTLFNMIGEICKASNEELTDVIYDIPWYNQSSQSQYIIKFMLMRSQIPLTFHVKGMGFVDKYLMSNVLKTAYSYTTVLLNMVFRASD